MPLAVAQFAQDTHSPDFFGRVDARDWIGGHVFDRLQDFLDYFRDIAVQNQYADPSVTGCAGDNATIATCTFDPRSVSNSANEFFGPDNRMWIWTYVIDRNQWVAAEEDRNIATKVILYNYTTDVIGQMDDGNEPGAAYSYLFAGEVLPRLVQLLQLRCALSQ